MRGIRQSQFAAPVLRRLFALSLLLLAASSTGCQAVVLLGYLIAGPPSIEPDFEKQTKKSLTEKGKTTLVLCYAPKELKWDNDAVDYEVAKMIALRLRSHQISVMDPDRVHDWLDKHSNWDKPDEVGAAFGVDYVIYVDLAKYSLFEEHSHDLYRGRAEMIVSVVEMTGKKNKKKKHGSTIYSKSITSRYPDSTPASANEYPYETFKKLYLSRLSDQIGWLFFEHYAGDDVPYRALL